VFRVIRERFAEWLHQIEPPFVPEERTLLALTPVTVWPPTWPQYEGGLARIPVGLTERDACYDRPVISISTANRYKIDRKFAQNLATVPAENFPNFSRRIYMHKKVRPYFIEAMNRAFEVCPHWEPERIGCFNPRRMRHSKNPRVPFSDHTYGIAFDIDPQRNRAWSRKKYPERPQPFDEGWVEYSSIPEGVIRAFESVGFEWGGRWKSFVDPMHFSLRKVR